MKEKEDSNEKNVEKQPVVNTATATFTRSGATAKETVNEKLETSEDEEEITDGKLSTTLAIGFVLLFVNIIAFAMVSYRKEKDQILIQKLQEEINHFRKREVSVTNRSYQTASLPVPLSTTKVTKEYPKLNDASLTKFATTKDQSAQLKQYLSTTKHVPTNVNSALAWPDGCAICSPVERANFRNTEVFGKQNGVCGVKSKYAASDTQLNRHTGFENYSYFFSNWCKRPKTTTSFSPCGKIIQELSVGHNEVEQNEAGIKQSSSNKIENLTGSSYLQQQPWDEPNRTSTNVSYKTQNKLLSRFKLPADSVSQVEETSHNSNDSSTTPLLQQYHSEHENEVFNQNCDFSPILTNSPNVESLSSVVHSTGDENNETGCAMPKSSFYSGLAGSSRVEELSEKTNSLLLSSSSTIKTKL